MVWTPNLLVAGSAPVYGVTSSASLFATQVGRQGAALMVPGSAITIVALPEHVNWRFSIGMSAAWDARKYFTDWTISTGLSVASLSTRLKTSAAIATCLLAVKQVVDLSQARIANGWVATSTLVSSVLSTGVGATTCAQRLRTVALEHDVRVPSYLSDLTRYEFKLMKQADSVLSKMQKAQNLFKYLLLAH